MTILETKENSHVIACEQQYLLLGSSVMPIANVVFGTCSAFGGCVWVELEPNTSSKPPIGYTSEPLDNRRIGYTFASLAAKGVDNSLL